MAKHWIQDATAKMEAKGTIGKFGKATPKKIAAGKKAGGVKEKEAVFASNMSKIFKEEGLTWQTHSVTTVPHASIQPGSPEGHILAGPPGKSMIHKVGSAKLQYANSRVQDVSAIRRSFPCPRARMRRESRAEMAKVRVTPQTASQAGEYAARQAQRDRLEGNAEKARLDEVKNRRKVGGSPDDDYYMKAVGDEGIKSQQKDMDKTASDAEAGYQHKIPSYKKGGRIRKTGLAYMHKGEKVTPVKKAQRKKG